MARRQKKEDTETRQGVFVVIALIVGALVLGGAMQYFWQPFYTPEESYKGSLYLNLEEQAIKIGDHSLLLKVSVEYVGRDTEDALKKALPKLQGQITSRLSQVRTSDLRKLRTTQGKQELANDILARVKDTLPKKHAENIKGILYEKFLIGE